MVNRQQTVPVFGQRFERRVELRFGLKGVQQFLRGGLVYHVGGDKLLILRVLAVAQQENEAPALAGREGELKVVAAYGRPAAGHAVPAPVLKHRGGRIKAPVRAQEAVTVRVEALHGGVHRVHGVMVAALPVLGLVVDGAALYLHFAGGEVALEVGGVVLGVPQAELHEAEQ